MRSFIKRSRWALLLALVSIGSACAAAAGAAAGAAAAIAYNERNASTELSASVSQVAASTEAVFRDMGIALTNREVSSGEAEIRGDQDGVTVIVEIEREDDRTTEVVVTARRGDVDYRPNRAGEILQRIIDRTG